MEISRRQATPEATERLLVYLDYLDRCRFWENSCGRDKKGRFTEFPKWPFETETVNLLDEEECDANED